MFFSATLLLLLGSAGVYKLGYAEFAELSRIPRRTLQQRRVIANAVLIQRTVVMLEHASTVDQVRAALEHGFPAACSAELRFALFPRNGMGITQGFRIRPEQATPTQGKRAATVADRTARLVLELDSPSFRGSLEFILAFSADEMILNVHQLSAQLHPALNIALRRIDPVSEEHARPNDFTLSAPLPGNPQIDAALLGNLQYVQ